MTGGLQAFALARKEEVWGTILGPVVILSPLIVTWVAFFAGKRSIRSG